MRYPKDLEIWEHAPGMNLAQVVVRMRNSKGALAVCSKAVSDLGVNILSGLVTAPSKSPVATVSFFADITNATGGLSELKRKLLSLDVVESVEALAAEDGFMVDKQHFPVQSAGRRAVLMRADALNEMLNRLWTVFGSGAVTIIDQMAEAMGRQFAKEIVDDFGPQFAVDQLDELVSTYTARGFAEVGIERSKSSEFPIVINAKELFECAANAKQRLHRKSAFFRAHLRGYMSNTFGRDFDVSEVQCLTEGDDVCSFRVALVETASPNLAHHSSEKARH